MKLEYQEDGTWRYDTDETVYVVVERHVKGRRKPAYALYAIPIGDWLDGNADLDKGGTVCASIKEAGDRIDYRETGVSLASLKHMLTFEPQGTVFVAETMTRLQKMSLYNWAKANRFPISIRRNKLGGYDVMSPSPEAEMLIDPTIDLPEPDPAETPTTHMVRVEYAEGWPALTYHVPLLPGVKTIVGSLMSKHGILPYTFEAEDWSEACRLMMRGRLCVFKRLRQELLDMKPGQAMALPSTPIYPGAKINANVHAIAAKSGRKFRIRDKIVTALAMSPELLPENERRYRQLTAVGIETTREEIGGETGGVVQLTGEPDPI